MGFNRARNGGVTVRDTPPPTYRLARLATRCVAGPSRRGESSAGVCDSHNVKRGDQERGEQGTNHRRRHLLRWPEHGCTGCRVDRSGPAGGRGCLHVSVRQCYRFGVDSRGQLEHSSGCGGRRHVRRAGSTRELPPLVCFEQEARRDDSDSIGWGV